MVQYIQAVVNWLRQPDFKDQDRNLSALYVQLIALAVITGAVVLGVVYAVVGQIGYVIFIVLNILIQIVVIGLIRFNKLQIASNLLLITALVLLTAGILSAGGIHASSVVLYPVILLFASLLLDRRSYIIYVVLCVVSIGLIIYAENQMLTPIYVPDAPELPLFLSVGLIVVSAAFISRFITENLQNNIRKARLYAQDLSNKKVMLDRVGQAVVGCLMDDTIIYWNHAAMALYGWRAEDVIGRKYYEVVPTQMTPEMIEGIRVALLKGETWSGEFNVQTHDQNSLTVLGTVSVLRDETGSVVGWIAVGADLSERVRVAEVDKRRAEEMALLYRLGVSLTSGRNLYDTLLALQGEITKLLQADAFYVAIYDEETDIVAYPIFFNEGNPITDTPRRLHERPGLTGAVIFSGKTLYLPNMFDPDVQKNYSPVDDDGLILHTFLGIPLITNGHTIGMLSVQSKLIDAYTTDQIQLMENIAIQAAIAIDKANLLDQLKQELTDRKRAEDQLREREAILESITFAAEQFLKTPDWRSNIDLVLERLGKTLNVTHAYLFEDHLNSDGEAVTSMRYEWTALGYPSDLDSEYFQASKVEQKGYEDQVAALRRGDVRIGNASTFNPIEKESMDELGVKAILEVPVFVNDREWGAIGFDDFEQEREWSNAEVDALKIAAGVLSAAIQRQEAESAVHESERIYRQAIEAAGAVPYYQDYKIDRYQFIGQGIQKITGYPPEEMTWSLWDNITLEQELIGDLAGLDVEDAARRVRNGEFSFWRCDVRILTRDGQSKWIADSAIELFDNNGIAYASIGIMQDITDRKQTEASLRQREAMLAATTYAAEQFLKSSDWRLNIEHVLERLGKTFHASHTYLFEHSVGADEVECSTLKYEWTAPGCASDFDNPYYQVPHPLNFDEGGADHDLRQGRVLSGNLSTFLPAERERLLSQGVKAMVEVPLFVDGRWWGTFGLDDFEIEREWNTAEVDAIKIAVGILSGAIQRQNAEAAVRESERIYRQAIQAAGAVPYYRNYGNDNYEFVGSEIEKMIGYKPEEVTVELMQSIMKENIPLGDGLGMPIDDAVAYARTGKFKIWRSDMRVIAKNGEEKWITDSAVELFDDSEFSYASVGIMQDVTDRKTIEAKLRKRESILEAITFSAEQFLKATDWRDRIEVVLERLGRELNASHAYLFEKHMSAEGVLLNSLRHEWTAPGQKSDMDNPDYQNAPVNEMDFRRYYEILDSGEPFVGSTSYFFESSDEKAWMDSTGINALLEMRIVVDGRQWGTIGFDDMVHQREWTPMEVDVLRVAANVLGAAIKRQMVEAALQKELDERKRAEQAMRFSEEKFSKAFHTTPVLMTIEDDDGRFIEVNNAFLEALGYDRDEVIGHRPSEFNLIPAAEDQKKAGQLQDENGAFKSLELSMRRKSGELRTALMSIEYIRVNDMGYVLTSALDITERKQAEAERERLIADLEAKNTELERFTYTVSHDLKSPLVTINGFLGYLEQDAASGNLERLKKDTHRIQEAVNKMQRLLNELLELSRIGRMMNAPQINSFDVLVREAMEIVQGRLNERNVRVQIQPNLPAVFGDRPRLVEVMQNLLDNAAKYMGDQPEPRVEIGQRGMEHGKPIFYVKDNGMGVAPEYHERIFGLFNKLDAKSEGTGVGLALVKRIIEVHDGRIWIESELGQGSTFYFTLPGEGIPK